MNSQLKTYALTEAQLNAALLRFVDNVRNSHSYVYFAYFDILYRTGARVSEINYIVEHFNDAVATFKIYSDKTDTVRVLNKDIFTLDFQNYLSILSTRFNSVNEQYLRDMLKCDPLLSTATVGFKPCNTHLFRHNFIRMKVTEGLSIDYIARDLLNVRKSTVESYLNSKIRVRVFDTFFDQYFIAIL